MDYHVMLGFSFLIVGLGVLTGLAIRWVRKAMMPNLSVPLFISIMFVGLGITYIVRFWK